MNISCNVLLQSKCLRMAVLDQLWLRQSKLILKPLLLPKHCIAASSTFSEPSDVTHLKKRKKSRIPLLNWFYDDVLSGSIKMNAFYLYAEITKQIDYLHFFKTFNLEDTFNSWFLITELHVWMLLARLRIEGSDGKVASKSLSAALWEDTHARAKALAPGSGVSKDHIVTLGSEFKGSLLIYDEGILGPDTVLASALWYRFLSMSCDDPRLIELIVAYVRYQMQNLDNTSVEDIILRVNLKWKPLQPIQ